MEEFVLFILTFVFLFIIYQLLFILPLKKKESKRNQKDVKEKKELLEIRYLKNCYALNFDKIHYPQLLQICAIVSSLDMAIAVSIVTKIHSFLWEIIVGFVVVCILIVISYHMVFLLYKKKGMVKNGKHK